MQFFFRVLLLSLFAAAGAGLAVSLACHLEAPAQQLTRQRHGRPFTSSVATAEYAPAESPASESFDEGPFVKTLASARSVIRPPVTETSENPALSKAVEWLKSTDDSPSEPRAEQVTRPPAEHISALLVQPAQTESISSETTPRKSKQDSEENPAVESAPLPPPLPDTADPRGADAEKPTTNTASSSLAEGIQAEGDDQLTINIRQADIREVLETLGQQAKLNILASPKVTGTVSATLTRVDAATALSVLVRNAGFALRRDGDFIYVGTKQDLQDLERADESVTTRIYRPNYVSASELQKLITPLLTQGVGEASVTMNTIVTSSPPKTGIAASSDQTGGDDFAGTEVLLVRDYESVLDHIDQVVAEVNQRPRQVALEAMILSVRLSDEHELGVNFAALRDSSNARLISGFPINDLADITLTDGGLKFGFLNSDVAVFIKALESIGDTNVVAAPRLMCLNKQRAEILIGSQLGYVSTSVTETSATQAVEFLEVGTQLRFRPFISDDGLIRLEVHPELSTGSVRIEEGFTLPDKDVTQVTTNIMCRDGCTVIIGGLIRKDLDTTTSQIPLLGSLPIAGVLFRQKIENTTKREIIVLLTPRIVREQLDYAEGSQAQDEFFELQANYADKMSITGKRHIGMQYLRKARAAGNAGDLETALRYVNLSIHYDSLNREAAALHAEVLSLMPPERDNVTNHLRQGLAPWQHPHPHQEYSKQGYPWQELSGPDEEPPPVEIYEESSPTPRVDIR